MKDMNIPIERIPNSYSTAKDIERYGTTDDKKLMVLDDDFIGCVSGKSDGLNEETRDNLVKSMNGYQNKMELFLAAYAQKNTNRLTKILTAIDDVDSELLQEWRLRTLDTEGLMDLLSSLSGERSKLVADIIKILDRTRSKDPVLSGFEVKEEESVDADYVEVGEKVQQLSQSSRKKVMKFLKGVRSGGTI